MRLGNSQKVCKLLVCVCVCAHVCVLVTESCLTLCNPVDYNPPGSFVHGVFQARTLYHLPCSNLSPDKSKETKADGLDSNNGERNYTFPCPTILLCSKR